MQTGPWLNTEWHFQRRGQHEEEQSFSDKLRNKTFKLTVASVAFQNKNKINQRGSKEDMAALLYLPLFLSLLCVMSSEQPIHV